MAKTIKCKFCGKELTSGFFKGEEKYLDIAGIESLVCCEECYNKHYEDARRLGKRFAIKVENYKKSTKKKVDEETLKKMFLTYVEEEKEQIARCGKGSSYANAGYFACDDNGLFAVKEFELGLDVSAKQMVKSGKKAEKVGEVRFSKDDITKLEYRTSSVGSSLGLFTTAHSFEVRFNDEKVLTYKPCITRMFFVGKGLFPHNQRKNAKQQCAAALEILKKAIGSDIPVVEVKKFN